VDERLRAEQKELGFPSGNRTYNPLVHSKGRMYLRARSFPRALNAMASASPRSCLVSNGTSESRVFPLMADSPPSVRSFVLVRGAS